DAVRLAGEASVGNYPIRTVQTMANIIKSTEERSLDRMPPLGTRPGTRGRAISRAAVDIAASLNIPFLVTFAQSGDSARRLSRLRAPQPIYAFTHSFTTNNV